MSPGPEDERHIGWLIADAARLLRTVFDRRVRDLGLTRSQWLALTRLHRRPGASQSDLAEMLEIEKPSAGRLIDRLEQNGWVERRDDPIDRRVNRVYLTPQAERVHDEIWPIAVGTVADATAGMDQSERDMLVSLLMRMKTTLHAMAENVTAADPSGDERDDDAAPQAPERAIQ